MKSVFWLAILLALLSSPVFAQPIGGYEMWTSWTLLDKASFVGGALSQAPQTCDLIAHYQVRTTPGLTYTSAFYACLTRMHEESIDSPAVIKEMDRLYKMPSNRDNFLGPVYREALKNLSKKKKEGI